MTPIDLFTKPGQPHISQNEAANLLLVVAVLLAQVEHWQLEGQRMFSQVSVAEITPAAEVHTTAKTKGTTKVWTNPNSQNL
jgi:hypothetical protein